MEIVFCKSEADGKRWEEFVCAHRATTNSHRWNWKQVIEKSFGWPTYYLMAVEDENVRGILPLVWQKSWVFGSFLSSMPYLTGGGIIACDSLAERRLLECAVDLARSLKVDHLELRHREPHHLNGLQTRNSKVIVVRPLEPDVDNMWKALDTKTRTKIRKGTKLGMVAEFGREELLDEFYAVFSHNMRDLGTPVYSRAFFLEILRAFPEHTHICAVRYQGTVIAASFLNGFRDVIEAQWSSAIEKYNKLKANMFLYWHLFSFAGQKGYRTFDFGRSTVGSGTHVFKMQWGSETVPLHWDYWLPEGNALPNLSPQNPKYKMAISLWRNLPLAVTNVVGPSIVRYLP